MPNAKFQIKFKFQMPNFELKYWVFVWHLKLSLDPELVVRDPERSSDPEREAEGEI